MVGVCCQHIPPAPDGNLEHDPKNPLGLPNFREDAQQSQVMPRFEIVARFQPGHRDDRLERIASVLLVAAFDLGFDAGERNPRLSCETGWSTFHGPSREGEVTEQAVVERTR